MNATVVTLHQGIPGLINGTLVNPYINYPFVPVTVALMENYTVQARGLGLRTKFYYTIRGAPEPEPDLHRMHNGGAPTPHLSAGSNPN